MAEEPAASAALNSDDQLMVRLQAGDAEMLAGLFERHQVAVFRLFLRLTGDRAASEDLVQEVFLRILKYRHTYQPGTRFATWMYQVARNAWADSARKRGREVGLDDETKPGAPHLAVHPDKSIEQRQEQELLRRALLLLPTDKREALVLSRFQGFSSEQIGALLGCDAGAAKVRVHRALRQLRDIFFRLRGSRTP